MWWKTANVHNSKVRCSTVQPSSWGTRGAYFACISSIYKCRTKKVVHNNCHSTFFILIYSSSLAIRQNDDIKAVKFHNVYSTFWVVLSFNDILVCFSMHTSSCARMAVITFSQGILCKIFPNKFWQRFDSDHLFYCDCKNF